MGGTATVPRLARAMAIEWRARRIADPLGRLRYLRRSTESRGRRRLSPWLRAACGLAWLSIPIVPAREALPAPAAKTQTPPPPAIWAVESTADHDLYSNGLRVENHYAVRTHARSYGVFARDAAESTDWLSHTEAAGIVYHATESDLAPFAPEANARLQRIDETLLEYIRRRQAYHFVIDRFGRVYRVVAEGDSANHAGHSVWADRSWVYCNLNAAFLAVAFEARTEAGVKAPLNAAQTRAGQALTDMLRRRHGIAPENCVVHAQVSVNPRNMEIGYHTDWATGFPFEEMGLPDNYRLPVASVLLFGFGYDSAFLRASGGRRWPGLTFAEESAGGWAASHGYSTAGYAARLRKNYFRKMAALHHARGPEETSDEQE